MVVVRVWVCGGEGWKREREGEVERWKWRSTTEKNSIVVVVGGSFLVLLIRGIISGTPWLDRHRVATVARPKPKDVTLARSSSEEAGMRMVERARSTGAEAG